MPVAIANRSCDLIPTYNDTFCNPGDDTCNSIGETEVYCCPLGDGQFIYSTGGVTTVSPIAGCREFIFSTKNTDGDPTLKTTLNGTSQSPWVKIAFQAYCSTSDWNRSASGTEATIITTGNISQPGVDCGQSTSPCSNQCHAVIKSFQYGWGVLNAGNKCTITIVDEQGGTFDLWAKRLATGNPEADSKPITGVYRMKVQFGWYIAGGGPGDICGQQTAPADTVPGPGQNHSYTIASPVMWFIPETISVHFENGKFIYTLEGVDITMRSQRQQTSITSGNDGKKQYFTTAVINLGLQSYPPFRVRFLSPNATGGLSAMKFVQVEPNDSECLGPYRVYPTNNRPPLQVIQEWINTLVVRAKDLTGTVQTRDKSIGITMNYDSTQDLIYNNTKYPIDDCEQSVLNGAAEVLGLDVYPCSDVLSDVGTLICMGTPVPSLQGNLPEDQIDARLKAVYVVNGGNCSPVISFNPVIKWNFQYAVGAGGSGMPISGRQLRQIAGAVLAGVYNQGGLGAARIAATVSNALALLIKDPVQQVMQTFFTQQMTNFITNPVEAELRVQGDPSDWLCSPFYGAGRCVGIIFINPFYLQGGTTDCPDFTETTNQACNSTLTNKGWFILGADHQIREGSYVTTLKLTLPYPGATLTFANTAAVVKNTQLGAWEGGLDPAEPSPFAGNYFASPDRLPVGSYAALPPLDIIGCPNAAFLGGGPLCDSTNQPGPGPGCNDSTPLVTPVTV